VIQDNHRAVRFNLVDAVVALVILGAIPLAYGSYVLFRAQPPTLASVSPVRLSEGHAERIEIEGTNLRPFLRVSLNATPAKSFLIGSFPLRLDSTAKLAQVLAQVEFYNLGFEYFSQYPKWIERVTKDDVQRVAKHYLNPQRYALVVVGNAAKAKLKQ